MIVEMSRVYIATHQTDSVRLMDRLGQMNLLHIEPVRPEEAVVDEELRRAIADLERAIQILSPIAPAQGAPFQEPLAAAREAIAIQSAIVDNQNRLVDLTHRLAVLEVWGNVRLTQLEELRQQGIDVRFFSVPQKRAGQIRAECAEIVARLPAKRWLVAAIDRSGRIDLPAAAKPIHLPPQDRPSLLSEASIIEADLAKGRLRLAQLSGMIDTLRDKGRQLTMEAVFAKALRSGLHDPDLFALQGWLPSDKAPQFKSRLTSHGIHAAIRILPATEQEVPPTLIRYHAWTRPVQGLLDMLGTLPGYREIDLSPFFMLALPLFAAMLIGDAGYGLLISLSGLFFRDSLTRMAGRATAQMILVFGLVTLFWGGLTANYFGVTPQTLARAGRFVESAQAGGACDYDALWSGNNLYSRTARMMRRLAPLWRQDPNLARFLIIKVSLVLGCLHLILARLQKAVGRFPSQRALAEFGWIIVLVDMLLLIWHVLFIGTDRVPAALWETLLAATLLCSWFGKPDRSVAKRLLLGFASSMLQLLSTFSDTMSYIRLFAVGLASYYIASAFNTLSAELAETATWFAAFPVLLLGHALNIGLAIIAIFAHGVRLNMLEFSNHAGVQWGGYAYQPFSTRSGTIFGKEPS